MKFRLGKILINPDHLRFEGEDPYDAHHLFVVTAEDDTISIYIAEAFKHYHIVEGSGLDEKTVVGGGSCFIDKKDRLVINDYSGEYRAIPKEAAMELVALVFEHLKKQGVELKGMVAEPNTTLLNQFWRTD